MITELEQEFFRVFGLEPFCDLPCNKRGVECTDNTYCGNKYPDITAEKLLEMIIIRATNYKSGTVIELEPDSNIEDLKYEVLRHFINYRSNFDKHQIQQLFKE